MDDELIPGIARNKPHPPKILSVTLLMQDGDKRSPHSIYACQVFFLALETPREFDETAGNSFSIGLHFAFLKIIPSHEAISNSCLWANSNHQWTWTAFACSYPK